KSIVRRHLLVESGLERGKLALDDLFCLVGEILLDILLQTTQQERSKHLVKATDDENLLFFRELHLVLTTRVGERGVEPFIESLDGFEYVRQHKVEHGPQFG